MGGGGSRDGLRPQVMDAGIGDSWSASKSGRRWMGGGGSDRKCGGGEGELNWTVAVLFVLVGV